MVQLKIGLWHMGEARRPRAQCQHVWVSWGNLTQNGGEEGLVHFIHSNK